jgi:hypothetical protein
MSTAKQTAAFSANCTANSISGVRACRNPPCRQTNHAATAMQMYRTVQTGPKSQLGGFHDGLASVAYQVGMLGVVATEPRPAAAKQTSRMTTNAAWSWIFFGFHLPGAAFIEILVLLTAIAATTIAFWFRSKAAGILMVPYLGWVAFASVLNFTIWRLNA